MAYSNPEAYERFMGRWSARLAPLFVRFVGIKDRQRILDVGCGTGTLSRELLASGQAIRVDGVDPIADYVSFARQNTPSRRAEFTVAQGHELAFAGATFDAALALLVLQDVADPKRTAAEMARVTRRGGVVAACQWDFRDGLPMLSLMWRAAEAVATEAVSRYQAERPILPCGRAGPEELAEVWGDAGISEVRTATLDLSMEFCSFEDFWLPFLGGATSSSSFAAAVNQQTGGALAKKLRDIIPRFRPDGSFVLPARAWAVAGIVGRNF
jgi:ubiquinone/menaquinone biosynthesis C-methylase UbiE